MTALNDPGLDEPRPNDSGLDDSGLDDGEPKGPRPDGHAFAGIAFDCDGVLADTDEPWADAERAVVERHGGRMTDALRDATHGLGLAATVELLATVMPGPVDHAALREELLREAAARVARAPAALPGAVETVAELARHWPVAVVSNSPAEVLRPLLASIGVLDLVRTTVAADQVAEPKPAPHSYLEVARRVRLPPARMLAVEDSPTGVAAARAAGCPVTGIAAPGRPHLADADRVLPDLPALRRWLLGSPAPR
ncbi:HAD family phosphatase [Actinomadura miaoliensis]|uniref:HAD family phosphatase n=1 Tax=Actinomadura miaoliensis TaxID=430685 RepID=A0ABP7VEM9_9ACTN